LTGGMADPLVTYEEVFIGTETDQTVCQRVGTRVALRFPDPEGRKDRSGRVIPHDFVLFGHLADQVRSVDDGIRLVWELPEVKNYFARVWDSSNP